MGGSSSKNKNAKADKGNREAPPVPQTSSPPPRPRPSRRTRKAQVTDAAVPPAAAAAENPPANRHDPELEQRLRRFYQHYNPSKLDNVAHIVGTWTGTSEELMEAVVKRYGPEPGDDGTPSVVPRLEAQPEAAVDVDVNVSAPGHARDLLACKPETPREIAETVPGVQERKEERELVLPILQAGAEPQAPLPQGLSDSAPILPLVTLLETTSEVAKTPLVLPDIESPVAPSNGEAAHQSEEKTTPHSFRRRLSAFFGVRAPHKLHTLEECILQYEQDQEGILRLLREAYGAEPTEEETQAYFLGE